MVILSLSTTEKGASFYGCCFSSVCHDNAFWVSPSPPVPGWFLEHRRGIFKYKAADEEWVLNSKNGNPIGFNLTLASQSVLPIRLLCPENTPTLGGETRSRLRAPFGFKGNF